MTNPTEDWDDNLDPAEVDWSTIEPLGGARNSVVSVRFNDGELDLIEKAAKRAGMPLTTYIRSAALADSGVEGLRRVQARLVAAAEDLGKLVG